MSLSERHIAIVKTTIPLLESAGPSITAHFYQRLFTHHPELQNVFNMSHQHSGKQQFALFSAIAAYAKHIDNPSVLLGAIERIANKHASLNIQPEHYPIVGHHLIETLRELAGDQFTADVEEAWSAAYGLLADTFIGREEVIYSTNNHQVGGWRGVRRFRLTEKRIESELVKSLVFEPTDGKPVLAYQPGQYIGIQLDIPNHDFQEFRQYSLSDSPNEETYQISVKREIIGIPGVVSNYLHDGLRLGDEVNLLAPAGDFFHQKNDEPVVLISAGVGITPMYAIARTLLKSGFDKSVYFLHACMNSEQHSFRRSLRDMTKTMSLVHHTWYQTIDNQALEKQADTVHHGYMDISQLEGQLPLATGSFYLCGPVSFMQFAKQQLVTLGVDEGRIFYEVFGPHEAF